MPCAHKAAAAAASARSRLSLSSSCRSSSSSWWRLHVRALAISRSSKVQPADPVGATAEEQSWCQLDSVQDHAVDHVYLQHLLAPQQQQQLHVCDTWLKRQNVVNDLRNHKQK
jgi:hypothetical protein